MQLRHLEVMGLRAFFVLSHVFILVHGACPPDNVKDFVAVPEEDYDRNYSSITSTNKRPYGFDKSTLYYNHPDRENPCFKVSGAVGRRLEIMFETVPESRLCTKTQTSSPMCKLGTLRWCVNAPANDTYVEFLCDSQCGEQDVSFWYRMVLGDLSSEDREDQWCDQREDEFPINLRQLPLDFSLPEETTKSPNSALLLGASVYTSFLLGTLVCILNGATNRC